MTTGGNGWSEYQRLVIDRLDRLDHKINSIQAQIDQIHREEISEIKVDIAMLKVKAGVFGLVGGFLPAAALALYFLFGAN